MIKGSNYLFIVLVFLAGCYSTGSTWTNEQPGELWKVTPGTFDECMARMDTMFAGKGRIHFKETEETVAVIELYQCLGDNFIAGWHLIPNPDPVVKKKKEHDQWDRFPWLSNHSDLSLFFSQAGINDPTEMVRIIFTCYHRKLNNLSYDPIPVIGQYKSFWIRSAFNSPDGQMQTRFGWHLNEQMKRMDDSLMNKYFFDRISLHDTMTISLFYGDNRFNSKPMSYTLEGLVDKKDSVNVIVSIRLSGINSSRNPVDSIWYDGRNKRKIGDIVEWGGYRHWYKKGDGLFWYW